MGRTRDGDGPRPAALPATSLSSFPSPSSSSSSDFEFTVALSPSSKRPCAQLCPADELFYKGQLLPLHLSPRISMVRTLLLASSSTSSSSDTTTTASRDSNGSTSSSSFSAADFLPECDSSRPSSVTEEEARRVAGFAAAAVAVPKRGKYLSSFATRLSSVFLHRGSKKDAPSGADLVINLDAPAAPPPPSAKKANVSSSSAAKEVIKKCVKKVKPLYEKLSSLQQKQTGHFNGQHHPPPPPPPPPHQQHQQQKKTFSFSIRKERFGSGGSKKHAADPDGSSITHHAGGIYGARHPLSFSGNLGKPRRKQWAASCPSSMRSSPSHSGLLSVGGGFPTTVEPPSASSFLLSSSSSSMEELQSAIQGAIAHCKSSMNQSTNHSNNKAPTGAVSSNKEDEISRS